MLNLPTYSFRIKQKEGKRVIFDAWRRKWVSLTPEEWVRQNFARYLTEVKHIPPALLGIEVSLKVNQQNFRADMVIFGSKGESLMVIECKAPEVVISQQVFDQIVRYNLKFQVKFLAVTNGITHYCCGIDPEKMSWNYLSEIPEYREILAY